MAQVLWLSFTDPDRPAGQQFLGVSVVEVTYDDLNAARGVLETHGHSTKEQAVLIAAAIRKAWQMGCNPGGEVLTHELLPEVPEYQTAPRHQLLSHAELVARDLIECHK